MTISEKFFAKNLQVSNISRTFAPAIKQHSVGAIAQLVEQRTENPCVPGSIPGGTTIKRSYSYKSDSFFVVLTPRYCISATAQNILRFTRQESTEMKGVFKKAHIAGGTVSEPYHANDYNSIDNVYENRR